MPCRLAPFLNTCFGLAINTAIDLIFTVGELEDLIQLLLDRGNTTGVFATDDIGQFLRHLNGAFFHQLLILDDAFLVPLDVMERGGPYCSTS